LNIFFKKTYFPYPVNKVQPPYRPQPKNPAVGNRGDTGKVEELTAQVTLIFIPLNNIIHKNGYLMHIFSIIKIVSIITSNIPAS